MGVYEFEGRSPRIASTAYVDDDAKVLGDVTIGPLCYIGPGARIRGDYGAIAIGEKTSIQENCVLHARINEKCELATMSRSGMGLFFTTVRSMTML